MYTLRLLILLVLTTTLASCDKVLNESKELKTKVLNNAPSEAEIWSKMLIHKVFPPFDHNKPDTENNKLRFKDFIKVKITPDIKNIYCFDDAIGIDADYMFSFDCDSTTSNKIIALHSLTIDTVNSNHGFGLQHDFDWWDKKKISQLQKYSWTDGRQYHKYYWYDQDNQKAYFFDFDM